MHKHKLLLLLTALFLGMIATAHIVHGKVIKTTETEEEISEERFCDFSDGSRVIKDGRISVFGTIHLFSGALESGRDDEGLECWSSLLLRYNSGEFRAEVFRDGLVSLIRVTDQAGVAVNYIRRGELFSVQSKQERVVGKDGYLFWKEKSKGDKDWNKHISEALRDVKKGIKPKFLDNSPYLRVSRDLIGKELIVLWLHVDTREAFVVFTKNGRRVPFSITYPLSYARWAPDHPLAQYSERER